MATTAEEKTGRKLTDDEAALEMVRLVEGYFDELGLSEDEREKRYAAAEKSLNAGHAGTSTSAA